MSANNVKLIWGVWGHAPQNFLYYTVKYYTVNGFHNKLLNWVQCYALFMVASLTYAICSMPPFTDTNNLDNPYKTASCQEKNWTPLKKKRKSPS